MNRENFDAHRVPLKKVRDLAFEDSVAKLYDESLPYHNFSHVQDTLAAASRILDRCHGEGIRVDTRIVYYALLFHDAGYQHDHLNLGYESKEAYSAALAAQHTAHLNFNHKDRAKLHTAIMATHRDGVFVTSEQKLVRAADLAGLSSPYPKFYRNTIDLWTEYNLLNDTISWEQWQQMVEDSIQHYLSQEIRLTSYYCNADGASSFHLATQANLQQFQQEPSP